MAVGQYYLRDARRRSVPKPRIVPCKRCRVPVRSFAKRPRSYCSSTCYNLNRRGRIAKCPECGKMFYQFRSYIGKRPRCSKKCANRYIARIYKRDKKRLVHLSRIRRSIRHDRPETRAKLRAINKLAAAEGRCSIIKSGPENPSWKGGITPVVSLIRHCPKYIEWRKEIFTRDNYTCRKCKRRGDVLHADHYPITFAEIIHRYKIRTLAQAERCRKLWDTRNGRTLCESCHRRRHGINKKVEQTIPA